LKRVAADQGGSGASVSGQRRREDKYTLEAAPDQPCKFHSTPGRIATHSTRECSFIKELEQRARQLPGPPLEQPIGGQEDREHELAPAADQGEDDYPAIVEQYRVFTTLEKDKRNDLWYGAEVNVVVPPDPQYMHWSEASITWGREDHVPLMPSPGEYALLLDPIVFSDMHTCHLLCVLIDGGSSINLLYRSSLEKLGIPVAQLTPSRITFHGCRWISCRKNTGYHATDPKDSNAGG
jgi:hypothetical protein